MQSSSQRVKRLYNLRAWTPKLLLGRLCGVLIALLVVALIINFFDKNKSPSSQSVSKDPCAFFTVADARGLLGKTTQKGGVPPVGRTSSKDTDIITCSYTQPVATITSSPVSVPKTAAVVVGAPKTALGKDLNNYEFNQSSLTKLQAVSGYGDKAYWDPQLGVLNVYKNNKWIIISNGSIASGTSRNLDDTKKLAGIVVPRL